MSLRLTIPEPCHENWQNMQPDKDGRHCLSCQKTVVDFSLMTDKEILDHLSASNGNLCGRFDEQQLDRNLHETKTRKKYSWWYIWMTLGLLWTGRAKAQTGVITIKTEQKDCKKIGKVNPLKTRPYGIPGTVVNEATGEPVPYASISIEDRTIATADSAGKFVLQTPRSNVLEELTISAVGFTSQNILYGTDNAGVLTVYLKPEVKELDEVVVVVNDAWRKRLGAYSIVTVTTTYERFTRNLFATKNITTYPNPLPPGNTMNVSLQLKQTGQYRVELIDAAGKIIWIQSLHIPSKKFNFSIPTQPTWSAGIYWLRISGSHTKQVYNSKVVIQ